MSSTVEERVVEMQFDNKQFESNTRETIKTLGELNKSLDLKGATNGFKNLDVASKSVDLSSISRSIDTITNKISIFGVVGDQVLRNLTNRATDFATKWAKDLTIGQVQQGWSKYEAKTNAVQVIMHSTGKSIDEVNKHLDDLTYYTDETSYRFDQMVDAISKFTGANVELGDAEKAVEGIANWAATAGVGPEKAASAFYNLSQAMSSGALRAQDWKSIEILNMNTVEFEETAIRVAKEMIADGRASQDMASKFKKANPQVKGFRDTLSTGWLDKDVMLEVFKTYSDRTTQFGLDAFHAAQEAKTFKDAVDAAKESVATGWANIFEQIFGNYEEAKVFWTEVANEMIEVFSAPTTALSELLSAWHDDGGYVAFINSIRNAWASVKSIGEEVAETFRNVIPQVTSDKLVDVTKRIENLTSKWRDFTTKIDIDALVNEQDVRILEAGSEKLREYKQQIAEAKKHNAQVDKNMQNLRNTFEGIFSIFKLAGTVTSALFKIALPFTRLLVPIAEMIGSITSALGEMSTAIVDTIISSDIFTKAVNKIEKGLSVFEEKLAVAQEHLVNFLKAFLDIDSGKTIQSKFIEWFAYIAERISSIFNSLKATFTSFGGWKQIFTGLYDSLSSAWKRISPILQTFQDKITEIFGGKGFGPKIFSYAGALAAVLLGFNKLGKTGISIAKFTGSIFDLLGSFKKLYSDVTGKISGAFGELEGAIKSFSENLKVDSIKKIASALLILAISLAILAAIDGDKLGAALAAAAAGLGTLVGAFALLQKTKVPTLKEWFVNRSMYTNIIKLSVAVLIISFAIGVLSKSVERLSAIDIDKLKNGVLAVVGLIAAVAAATKMVSKETGLSPRVGIAIIAMAVGISILSKAVERLSVLNPDELMTGLAGVLGLLYVISEVGKNMAKGNGLTPKAGIGIIAMAAGILILVKAVEMLGNLENAGTLESGLFALGALMAMVTAMGYYLKDSKNIVGIGISMIAFGVALRIMVSALESINSIGDISGSLFAIGALLAMIAAFSTLVSYGTSNFGAISLAMIAFSASLVILSAALSLLSKLSWIDIIKSLVTIGGALLLLGVAAVALSGFIPALFAVTGALAFLGAAIFLTAAGVALLSVALIALASAGAAGAASIVASITIIANGLLGLVGTLTTGVALFITGLIVALAKSAGAIARALADMIISVIGTLAVSAPELVKSIAELLINIFVSLGDYAPQIIEGALSMIDKVLAGLVESLSAHAGNIFAAVGEVLNTIIDGSLGIVAGVLSTVGEYSGQVLGAIGGAIGEVFGEIVGGLLEGISSHFDEIATNMDSFLEAISPFVERLNTLNIDPSKIEALKSIAEAILVLTEAKILDGLSNITSFLTGGKNSFADFAKELAYMGPAMATYGESVAGVDSDAIAKSAKAISALANVSKSLGRNGGLISAALGKPVTLSEFATQLVASIPGIKAFADAAPTIASNAEDIEKVAGVIESIVKVANKLNPEHTELLWGAYVKDAQNLGDFMRQFSDSITSIDGVETTVKGIGSNLVEFSNSMKDISVDDLNKGKDAIAALVALAEPLQGKTNTLSVFGSDIWTSETTSGLVSMLGGLAEVIPLLNTAFKDMEALEVTKFDMFSKSLEKIVSTEVLAKENDAFGGRLQTIASFLIDSALSFKEAGERISEISFEDINTLFAWLSEHNDDLVAKGTQAVQAVQDGMTTAAELGAIDVADKTVNPVFDRLTSAMNELKARAAGKFLVDGFAAGITANIHTAMAAAGNLSEATIQQMRRTLRIGSPSRIARQIGDWTGEGFTIGVSDWLHASGQVGESLAESVTKSAEATIDYLTRLLNGDMVVSMTIRPVLDLTDVRNGAMTIDSMFTQRQALMAQLDSSAMDQSAEIAELVNVSWQILREIQNGRDIYLDGRVLAGSMNRRLGRMEGL